MILTPENLRDYCTEEGECWLWNLSLKQGYPQATIGKQGGVLVRRHVFGWTRELRKGWRIYSTCGERRCVNPAHLNQASPGRILEAAYRDGRRLDNYANKLAMRQANHGLPKVLTPEERQFIDSNRDAMNFDRLAAAIGRSPSAVARYVRGETHRKSAPNSSVFAWRP